MLVTGASVAGPAAAYWLDRIGYDVTVLERSADPRRGGQNVDIRGLVRDGAHRRAGWACGMTWSGGDHRWIDDAISRRRGLQCLGRPGRDLRPDNLGTTRPPLGFMSEPVGFEALGPAEQRARLRERFGDLAWEVPRVLDAIDASDELYVEDLTQVICPTWSSGRVVLLGDAAWCVTPVGGAGTSLALTGAYVLAVELSRLADGDSPEVGFKCYEEWMRPLVEDAQDLPPGTPGLANPQSRLGTALFRAGTKLAALRPVRAVASKLTSGPDTERPLPDL